MKQLPPDQEEIERAQRDLFKSGDIKAVARCLDVDPSYISKCLNPDNPEHKGPLYTFLRWLWACDQEREGLGDDHLALVTKIRNACLGKRTNGNTVEMARSVTDNLYMLIQAEKDRLPYTERMQFLENISRVVQKHMDGLRFNDLADGADVIPISRDGTG